MIDAVNILQRFQHRCTALWIVITAGWKADGLRKTRQLSGRPIWTAWMSINDIYTSSNSIFQGNLLVEHIKCKSGSKIFSELIWTSEITKSNECTCTSRMIWNYSTFLYRFSDKPWPGHLFELFEWSFEECAQTILSDIIPIRTSHCGQAWNLKILNSVCLKPQSWCTT